MNDRSRRETDADAYFGNGRRSRLFEDLPDDEHQFLVPRQASVHVAEIILPAESSDQLLLRRSDRVEFETVENG